MPIYEYRCGACGHTLEALQKISDSPLRKCPECGKSSLRRLVSAVAFRLKGAGWYETDFKRDGETKRNLVEAAKESSDSTSADGGTKEAAKDSSAAESKKAEAKPAEPSKKSTKTTVAIAKKAAPKPRAQKPAAAPRVAAKRKPAKTARG